ncbi:DUF6572 domain-containing protein [Granulicella sp. S190]|uniref:DUF6572 domain-containing protein n=1 Tax=Granulicella sp. S190 TaxID=1747226 RepID=UPI00131E4F44|nr:DUF6572 domain-containing protein [Granulicella sp. S190]
MSVDQFDTVDVASVNEAGEMVLTISDHLDWSDTIEHQSTLQKKFNAYLAFVEGGEMLQKYPDAKARPVVLSVVFKFRPDQEGLLFLTRARQVIESAGFSLRHEVFAESYDN